MLQVLQSSSCDLCDWAVLGLIKEQRLEHVIVEGWVVEAGSCAVWVKV